MAIQLGHQHQLTKIPLKPIVSRSFNYDTVFREIRLAGKECHPYFRLFSFHWLILLHYILFNQFSFVASHNLTLLDRSPTKLLVEYTPTEGITDYAIVARNSEFGAFAGVCKAGTHGCELKGLPIAKPFVLWLRSCRRSGYLLCDLRALPLEVYTLPECKHIT